MFLGAAALILKRKDGWRLAPTSGSMSVMPTAAPSPLGERDLYYPVFYVEPLKGNEPAAGFDLGSNPTRLAALERARDTGQAAATGRINLVQEKGGVYGFLVFVPVYRRGTQPATVEQRRSTLQGFALAVFNSDLLMRPLLRAREAIGLDFDLLDLSGSEAERLLYRWVSPLLGGSLWESSSSPYVQTLNTSFPSLDADRGLQFTPNRAYLERDYPLAYWLLLPGGFLITIVLALYLHTVLSQSSRLEREVSERTAKLLESERRMASVLANVQDAYFRADLEGRLVIVSPSGARMYGYASPEEMIGLSARDLYADAAERKSVREELRRLGRVDDRVGRAARRDGRELYVSLNTQFCFDEHGAIAGTEGFVRDVTERRRTENVKAAIYEISEAAQQAPSLDDLFAAIHRIVGRLMEARNFYIALYDSTTNLLSFPYFVDEVDARPDPFPAGQGVDEPRRAHRPAVAGDPGGPQGFRASGARSSRWARLSWTGSAFRSGCRTGSSACWRCRATAGRCATARRTRRR